MSRPMAAAVVERATPGQITLVTALHRQCFQKSWSAAEFARLMAMPGALALLARADPDAPAAGLLLARVAGDEAEILTVGVMPAARRRGLGRALLEAAADRLAGEGAGALFIEVAVTNDGALGLYRGLGFEEVGRRADYYDLGGGRREDALVMRLALPGPAMRA